MLNLILWFNKNKTTIFLLLGVFFIFLAGGYIEAWELMKVFIFFTIGVVCGAIGIVLLIREENR